MTILRDKGTPTRRHRIWHWFGRVAEKARLQRLSVRLYIRAGYYQWEGASGALSGFVLVDENGLEKRSRWRLC